MLIVHKRDAGLPSDTRMLSAGTDTGVETFHANVSGTVDSWSFKANRRPGGGPYNLNRLTLARRYWNPVLFYKGEIAEVFFFNDYLETGAGGLWTNILAFASRKYQIADEVRGHCDPLAAVAPMVITVGSQVITDFVADENSLTFEIPAAPPGNGLPQAMDLTLDTGGSTQTYPFTFAYYDPAYLTHPSGAGVVIDPSGNGDGDEMDHLLEYLFDTDYLSPDTLPVWWQHSATNDSLELCYRRNNHATDALLLVERTDDLVTWETTTPENLGAAVFDSDPDGDGSATIWKIAIPLDSNLRLHRLKAVLLTPPLP